MRTIVPVSLAMVMVSTSFVAAGQNPGKAVDRLQGAYRSGSVEGMIDAYSADATFLDVNQRHHFTGTEQLRAMLQGIVAMHLSMDVVEIRRAVDGKNVVVEYEYRGQLDGAALGASVGKQHCPDLEYVLPATSWYEVENGKIVRQKDFIDWATFLDLRRQMLASGEDVDSGDAGRSAGP